jgi:hypothetical protein
VNPKFVTLVELLEPKLQELLTMKPTSRAQLPRGIPKKGIYLFSEGSSHLYVGRSDNLRNRLGLHCRPGSQHNQATFAFRMARQQTGNLKAAYTAKGSRSALVKDPYFLEIFNRNKEKINNMDLRFVEEADPTKQAVLEIYIATVLETPFNDFENH